MPQMSALLCPHLQGNGEDRSTLIYVATEGEVVYHKHIRPLRPSETPMVASFAGQSTTSN